MSLSGSDGARPMRDADPALAGIIRRRLENALGDRDRASAGVMSTRVRRILVAVWPRRMSHSVRFSMTCAVISRGPCFGIAA